MHTAGPMYALEPLEGRLLLSGTPRQMEYLNRGMVAVNKSSSSVYVSWRLLGTDPQNVAFNVYRSINGGGAVKLNANPLTATTDYTDNSPSETSSVAYFVKPVIGGVEQAASESWTIAANTPVRQYLNIPLTPPAGGQVPDVANPGQFLNYTYSANDASVGDVDGDGQYEIILKWDSSLSKDSSQDGFTGPTYYDCYKLDGTRLWRINLGQNIRAGAHYTQFMVYDLDGDGKAEVVMKTAPGTIDGQGNPVLMGSDKVTDDYRSSTSGRINTGPEYLTVFNGQTGAAMTSVAFKPDRINTSSWGDDYGNRQDRILMAIAYLDGQHPSVVVGRGIFPNQSSGHAVRNEITAWDFRNNQLTMRWWFRADQNTSAYGLPNINTSYIGQGNYEMQPADVDGDGKDEIIYGSITVDDNGSPLYSTGMGHGDALSVSDMDPARPGLETHMPMESPGSNGHITANVHQAADGKLLFGTYTTPPGSTDPDNGRGNANDIDPRYPGFETWDAYNGSIYNISTGQIIQSKPSNMFDNFGIWWDADPMRELLDGTTIGDWRITNGVGGRSNYVFAPSGLSSNNGSKSNPCLVADLLGDWREEVIWRHSDASGNSDALQIWTTTIAATNRYPTLMHDTQYRESVAWQNVGYNQPTDASFFLGATDASGTPSKAPQPNIYTLPFGQPQVNVPAGISGHIFQDDNNNGVQDGSEQRINDAVVYIDANNNGAFDTGEQSIASDAQGNYIFTGLSNGTYTIRASLSSEHAFGAEIINYSGAPVTAADLGMEPIAFNGLITADNYTVRLDASGNIQVLLNNTLIDTLNAKIPSLTFNGLTGSDSLTTDGINGTPIPSGGISFDGASGADAQANNFVDSITIKGTTSADTVSISQSSIVMNGKTLSYSNVEAITYTGQGGSDNVAISDGPNISLPDASIGSVTMNSGGSATIPAASSGGISPHTISSLTVNTGGTLTVASAVSQSNRTVLVTSSLTVDGLLDLGSNDMIVHGGNAATINAKVAAAANLASGYWNGAAGISSTAAANNAAKTTALGVLRNDNGAASAIYSSFDGQPTSFGDVLVKYTIYGDANLDGSIGTLDFVRLSQNFNAANLIWGEGDFNYDGGVNALDFNVLATKFGATLPAPAMPSPPSSSALAKASAPLDLFSSAAIGSNPLGDVLP